MDDDVLVVVDVYFHNFFVIFVNFQGLLGNYLPIIKIHKNNKEIMKIYIYNNKNIIIYAENFRVSVIDIGIYSC